MPLELSTPEVPKKLFHDSATSCILEVVKHVLDYNAHVPALPYIHLYWAIGQFSELKQRRPYLIHGLLGSYSVRLTTSTFVGYP